MKKKTLKILKDCKVYTEGNHLFIIDEFKRWAVRAPASMTEKLGDLDTDDTTPPWHDNCAKLFEVEYSMEPASVSLNMDVLDELGQVLKEFREQTRTFHLKFNKTDYSCLVGVHCFECGNRVRAVFMEASTIWN